MKVKFLAKDLTISYKNFKVSHVSFELNEGDIMGLVGRSGAGKSTIIKSLVGIKKQDNGEIIAFLDDKKIPLNKLIGYSPQSNSLYPYLTLQENLEVFGKLYGIDQLTIEKRMEYYLKRLDLKKCKGHKIIELSGGMQKRADLAVSLIHKPKIIIMDEPFAGLDLSLQKFIWEFLEDLAKEGSIIILSTHMLMDVQQYCNKFGLIEKGYFYGTDEIKKAVKQYKEKDIQSFLKTLFSKDLIYNR